MTVSDKEEKRSSILFWALIPWSAFLNPGGPGLENRSAQGPKSPQSLRIRVGSEDCRSGQDFRVQFAFTEHEREVGLSGRRVPLKPDEGMLFVFPSPQPARFWMKNTQIPLSILFFDRKGQLMSGDEMPVELHPDRPTRIYSTSSPTSAVLELSPGHSGKFRVKESYLCVIQNF